MIITKNDEFIKQTVNLYSGLITRIAFQYTRNKLDAEDIMQDVFFALLKQPCFDSQQHLKAWLIRVCINKSRDFLRLSKRRKTVELSENYQLDDTQSMVFDQLARLSEKDRNILYLYYYEGYVAKEIADILDIKEGVVFMRLSRAREKLKKILEEEND